MVTPKNGSVFRAFDILNAFCTTSRPLSASEVAEATGLAVPTAHRFLLTLEEVGAVARRDDNKYRLGFLMAELGRHAADRDVLAEQARSHVETLAQGVRETVSLATFDAGAVRPIVWAEPGRRFAFSMARDQDFPLHATALGRLFLAALPTLEREVLVGTLPLTAYTKATITDVDALRRASLAGERRGVFVVRDELEDGLTCVAVPLKAPHGSTLAALCISGPSSRLCPQTVDEAAFALKTTATRIGRGLFIETRTLSHKAQPLGRFPHVKRVDNLAFVSGTSARRPDNSFAGVVMRPGMSPALDVHKQTRETLLNVSDILTSVGSSLSNILQLEAYLTEYGAVAEFYGACETVFGEWPPSIQAVAAKALPHPHQAVMIKAVAQIAPTAGALSLSPQDG